MQKKLIALAVAGLASSAAFAQSNVTIYGIADIAYVHSSSGSSKTSGVDSGGWSSSRLGFRGTEDLGDGMKAVFTLEYGLAPDVNSGVGVTATGGGNARQTWVGLQNSTGTIKLGRQNSLGKNGTDKYDAMASTTFSPLYSVQRGNGVGSLAVPVAGSVFPHSLWTSGRFSNAVTFDSASMSGLVISAQYAFGGVSNDDTLTPAVGAAKKESNITIGGDYTMGDLGVNYIHQRSRDIADVAGNKASENFIGAAYNFGVAKLMGTFQTAKRTVAGVKLDSDKMWSLGVQVPVTTVSKVYFGYAKANDGSAASNDFDSWGIQYSHELSKRTMLYGGYQRLSNDNLARGTVLSNTAGRAAVVAGANTTGFGVGVRHTF